MTSRQGQRQPFPPLRRASWFLLVLLTSMAPGEPLSLLRWVGDEPLSYLSPNPLPEEQEPEDTDPVPLLTAAGKRLPRDRSSALPCAMAPLAFSIPTSAMFVHPSPAPALAPGRPLVAGGCFSLRC